MIRIFRHYVPRSLALLGLVEALALFLAIDIAARVRLSEIGVAVTPIGDRLIETFIFVIVLYLTMLAVGLYRLECCRDLRQSLSRMIVAWGLALVFMGVLFYLFPALSIWRSISVYALVLSFLIVFIIRWLFSRFAHKAMLRRRILVLGAGHRAGMIETMEDIDPNAGFTVVGFVRMMPEEKTIREAIPREEIDSLAELIDGRAVDDVVLAIDERRGTLPISDLLEARLRGTHVIELADFLERETGRVNLETLRPSTIIFSQDFQIANRLSQIWKRGFDVAASIALLLFSLPVLIIASIAIKLTSRGPVFYRQVRVGRYGQTYKVLKFRSMYVDAEHDGKPRWADADDPRVTPVGKILRATRVDEIPQIFNVLKGDMSFVGPRPERPFFVDELARELPFYAERHSVKPGITGWAQLNYPYGASIEDARAKLEYDLYYVKNYTIFLDILILIQTVRVVLWQDGAR